MIIFIKNNKFKLLSISTGIFLLVNCYQYLNEEEICNNFSYTLKDMNMYGDNKLTKHLQKTITLRNIFGKNHYMLNLY